MSQAALVNPSLLTWSRERAGLSTEQVAKKLPVKPDRVQEWEAGETKPTFLQAQKWASRRSHSFWLPVSSAASRRTTAFT